MTLEQLRIFVAAAERQHITQAAKALNLAQSAVSHAIAQLEAEFGLALFNRIGRTIRLTEAGRLLLADAHTTLAAATRTRQHMAELSGLQTGTLHLHASQTIGNYWLPSRLKRFRDLHPDITLHVAIGNTQDVIKAVNNSTAELGFVEGQVSIPSCHTETIAKDQIILTASPEHPLATQNPLTPAKLAKAQWVMREPGSGTRTTLEETLSTLGIPPETLTISLELPSNEAIRAAIEAGLGIGAISASVVAESLENERLVSLPLPLPARPFTCIHNHHLSPAAKAFHSLITTLPHHNKAPRLSLL